MSGSSETIAAQRIAELREDFPTRYELARLVSVAARVAQPFLRSVRLSLVPEATARDETELWFGPLVENFNASGFTFGPEVAHQLRETLRGDRDLINRVGGLLEKSHASLSPVVRLEERVTTAALAGEPPEALEQYLAPVLRGILNPQRHALSRWVRRAMPRLPSEARDLRVAEELEKRALVINEAPGAALTGDAGNWRSAVKADGGKKQPIWLCRTDDALELSLDPDRRTHALRQEVTASTPMLVQASWWSGERERRRLLRLPAGFPVRLQGVVGPVRLEFSDGQTLDVVVDDPLSVPPEHAYRIAKVAVFWPGGDAVQLCESMDAMQQYRTEAQPVFSLRLSGHGFEQAAAHAPLWELAMWPDLEPGLPLEIMVYEASAVLIGCSLDGGQAEDVAALLEELRRACEVQERLVPPILLAGMRENYYHQDVQVTHEVLLGMASEWNFRYEPRFENVDSVRGLLSEAIDWDHGPASYIEDKYFEEHRYILPWFGGEGYESLPLEKFASENRDDPDDPYAPKLERLIGAGERLGVLNLVGTADKEPWIVPATAMQRFVVRLLEYFKEGRYPADSASQNELMASILDEPHESSRLRLPVISEGRLIDLVSELQYEVGLAVGADVEPLFDYLSELGITFRFDAGDQGRFLCIPTLVKGAMSSSGAGSEATATITWGGPAGRALQKILCRLSVEQSVRRVRIYDRKAGASSLAHLKAAVETEEGVELWLTQPNVEEPMIDLVVGPGSKLDRSMALLKIVQRILPDCVPGAEFGFGDIGLVPEEPRVGHRGAINAVAVTTDARFAVSASSDNTLNVWALDSGELVHTLAGHEDVVNAVALTADSRRAVSASGDHTLKVWGLDSGELVHTLAGHEDAINAVALTADSRRAVSASGDHTLKVWDLDSGELVHTLAGHEDVVNAVALTADSRRAVSASGDHTLKVWGLDSGELVHTLAGHEDAINAVALTADSRWAVSASGDHTLKVWDLDSGDLVRTLVGHEDRVTAIAVPAYEDGWAVSGSADKSLKIWNLSSGTLDFTLSDRIYDGHDFAINAVDITRYPDRVVSGSTDWTVKVWNPYISDVVHTFSGHEGAVNAIALTPDERVVSASEDGTLKVWDLETGDLIRTLGKKETDSHEPIVVGKQTQRARPLDRFRDALPDGSYAPEMIVIPPGRFMMGSSYQEEDAPNNGRPQHPVNIPQPFAIGSHLVTLGQFRHFLDQSGYEVVIEGLSDKIDPRGAFEPNLEQTLESPVTGVSRADAEVYADWLTEQTGQSYRLPSEAELEYAALAGSTGLGAFSNDADNLATRKGGVFINPWGLHQLYDQISQWCADCWHDSYAGAPADGSAWVDGPGGDCEQAVIWGKSISNDVSSVRSTGRDSLAVFERRSDLGFRLARDIGNLPPSAEGTTEPGVIEESFDA